MTWLAPIPLFPEAGVESAALWPVSAPACPAVAVSRGATPALASASAAPTWRWTSTLQTAPVVAMEASPAIPASDLGPERVPVRMPADLVRRMALAARMTGKSECEVWAEAARTWLQRRECDDDFPPTPPAAAQPCPRRERTAWVAIDALLVDLRAQPSEPAAA